VQVATTAPQTTGWLLAVFPNVAELLAVIASLFLALYCSTLIEIWQRFGSLKISWDFAILGKVMRNKGMFMRTIS
jgi:hypothetical protein